MAHLKLVDARGVERELDVADFYFERGIDGPGALVVTDQHGARRVIPVDNDQAPAVVAQLRPKPVKAAKPE